MVSFGLAGGLLLGFFLFSKEIIVVNEKTFASSHPQVFFGGDSAWGPKNVITAVAHGHQAAISIDLMCKQKNLLC